MAENNSLSTAFNKLGKTLNATGLFGGGTSSPMSRYNMDDIIAVASSRPEYEMKKKEAQQNLFLGRQWKRVNMDLSVSAMNSGNLLLNMYRDADIMDTYPLISRALDIYADEATVPNAQGKVITVTSSSERIRSILEDLFENRLGLHLMSRKIIRNFAKYGNGYNLLDLDSKHGVIGWRELPPAEIQRLEHGVRGVYGMSHYRSDLNDPNSTEIPPTRFLWLGQTGDQHEFNEFQIAHFRLLGDTRLNPYGVSLLNGARRDYRKLMMMEDMMLLYRMDRSVERRIYKIFVGDMDEDDVQAYVESVANEMKRTPIFDPETGQLDLRKNSWSVLDDLFLPTSDPTLAANPVDTLAAGQNLTAMDDIKYVRANMCAGIGMNNSLLGYEESVGEGQNLAMIDIRFARQVNHLQQAYIAELNKIAMIHLSLLGFDDELTNFSISMNNPSTQAETLAVENYQKKLSAIRDATSDPGTGMPIMSTQRALREIMHWTDQDIKDNWNEIRVEKALADELQKTSQIITRTHLFDDADNKYGEYKAEYQQGAPGGDEGGFPGGGGGAPGGGFIGGGGGDFSGGAIGDEIEGLGNAVPEGGEADITGQAGNAGLESMTPNGNVAPPAGGEGGAPAAPLQEDKLRDTLSAQAFESLVTMKQGFED